MSLTIEEILFRVRAKFDEVGINDSDFQDQDKDDSEMDQIIIDKIIPSLSYILINCSSEFLEGSLSYLTEGFLIDEKLVGHLTYPDNVIRVVNAKLSSWTKSCKNYVTEDSDIYAMQSDKYACGTYERPILALANSSTGREFQFFHAKASDDTLSTFCYISKPAITDDGKGLKAVQVPEKLVDAFIYFTAALSMQAYNNELYEILSSTSQSLMGYAIKRE